MTTLDESQEFYKMIRENRFAMYSKPRRYYNRDGIKGSALKFLFFVQAIIFILIIISAKTAFAQLPENQNNAPVVASAGSISGYTTVYNSGKVFINWTARNEPADCIYLVERSADGKNFESVGIKEGIGTNVELFYSWIDNTPPSGYAFYRVKKINADGTQYYSAVNSVINQGSSFDPRSNYAQGSKPDKTKQ